MAPRLEVVGQVVGFFAQPSAAVIKLSAPLSMGDVLYVKGATSDFQQTVDSMQIGHQPMTDAEAGQEIGLRVVQKCRKHDLVYKLVTSSFE